VSRPIESIAWRDDYVRILDQTRLPEEEVYLECRTLDDIAGAIKRLSIRGAPAIGIAAAMGLAFLAGKISAASIADFIEQAERISAHLLGTRPTAVNLRWALERMDGVLKSSPEATVLELQELMKKEARSIHAEDTLINRRIGEAGQEKLPQNGVVITVCNTGSLATGGHGTALGVVRSAIEHGKNIFVAACETRPLLQGARLTAWELMHDGIPFELITDGMAANYMKCKGADAVIAGADRVAANGDSANKIGTYSLAVLARAHGIEFYIAAPLSTIDMMVATGSDIPIEERAAEEVTTIGGRRIAPDGTPVWNPAFDVVPAELITGIMTEKGVVKAPYSESIAALFG
jgi:methylthioribose-1-phosphate isomerase